MDLDDEERADVFKELQEWRIAHKKAHAKAVIEKEGRYNEMMRIETVMVATVCLIY